MRAKLDFIGSSIEESGTQQTERFHNTKKNKYFICFSLNTEIQLMRQKIIIRRFKTGEYRINCFDVFHIIKV